MARDFHETFVEGEVVSDGVLPTLLVITIVRKILQKKTKKNKKIVNQISPKGQMSIRKLVMILMSRFHVVLCGKRYK